jgi:hypothetical protein
MISVNFKDRTLAENASGDASRLMHRTCNQSVSKFDSAGIHPFTSLTDTAGNLGAARDI